MEGTRELLTIGHSTHPIDRFEALLRAHAVERLCDVRRYPGSRRHPQFNAGRLATALNSAGIAYEGLGERLGGRRGGSSPFQAYAEHMKAEGFASGLERLEALARDRRTAIMCAESDWRRCHRRLIADALTAHGWQVIHIGPDGVLESHEPPLASPAGG